MSGVIAAACQWGMLKAIFLIVGVEGAGWYAYALAILAPVMGFCTMGVRGILATDGVNQFPFRDYFHFRALGMVISFVVAQGVFLLVASPSDSGSAPALAACVALFAYRTIDGLGEIFQGEYQRSQRLDVMFLSIAGRSLACCGLFCAALAVTKNLVVSFSAAAVVAAVIILVYDARRTRLSLGLGDVSPTALKKLAAISLPISISYLLLAAHQALPRLSLEHYHGYRDLAGFAALSYFAVLTGFVTNAISTIAGPQLSRSLLRSNREYRTALVWVLVADVGLFLVTALLFFVGGERLMALLFSPEVASYADSLLLVAVLALVTSWDNHLGVGLTVLRRLKMNMILLTLRTALAVPLTLYGVHKWGVNGALAAAIVLSVIFLPWLAKGAFSPPLKPNQG